MARKVFFGFHYQNDIWRVNQVRNSDVTKDGIEEAGFFDYSLWEKSKTVGDEAVKGMIRDALEGTSVTAILLGAETAGRPYVRYELEESCRRGNGILAIYIHQLADRNGYASQKGPNILDQYTMPVAGEKKYLSSIYRTYDWVNDGGYDNFGTWVETAAKEAGR